MGLHDLALCAAALAVTTAVSRGATAFRQDLQRSLTLRLEVLSDREGAVSSFCTGARQSEAAAGGVLRCHVRLLVRDDGTWKSACAQELEQAARRFWQIATQCQVGIASARISLPPLRFIVKS